MAFDFSMKFFALHLLKLRTALSLHFCVKAGEFNTTVWQ